MSDDPLAGLFEQLDFEDEAPADDLWNMGVFELDALVRKLDKVLSDRGELLFQTTQEGRDLHSRRGAARIVLMQKRSGERREAD